MLYEDVDSCLLRLFESFLEAAPQLTWQLYIVVQEKEKQDLVGSEWLGFVLTFICHLEKAPIPLD